LFTVRNSEGPGSPRSEPWLFDLATKRGRPLTGLGQAHTAVRWSPDGASLAYRCVRPEGSGVCLAQGDGSGASFLAPVTDTNHPLPAVGETLAWSPDSRRIAFLSATAGPEGPSPGDADPVVITATLQARHRPRFNDNRRLHIFVVDTATCTVRQLTDGPYHEHSLAWSPLGDETLFQPRSRS
jgi:Tol biopolymer transport system component